MDNDLSAYILLTLDALQSGRNEIAGKTYIMKATYFLAELMRRDLGYRPHFFGPYSETVDNSLDVLTEFGLVAERCDIETQRSSGFERRLCVYKLTKEGKNAAQRVAQDEVELAETIRQQVQRIRAAAEGMDYEALSFAAKTHFLLKSHEDAEHPTVETVRSTASCFNWKLDVNVVESSADFLRKLDLVRESVDEVANEAEAQGKP